MSRDIQWQNRMIDELKVDTHHFKIHFNRASNTYYKNKHLIQIELRLI